MPRGDILHHNTPGIIVKWPYEELLLSYDDGYLGTYPFHPTYHVAGVVSYFVITCVFDISPDIFFSAAHNGKTSPRLPVAGADSVRVVRFSLTRMRMSDVDNASHHPRFFLLIPTVNRVSQTVTVIAFTVQIPLSLETVFKLFVFCRFVPPNTGVYTASTFTACYPDIAMFPEWCDVGNHLSDSSFSRRVRNEHKGIVDTNCC